MTFLSHTVTCEVSGGHDVELKGRTTLPGLTDPHGAVHPVPGIFVTLLRTSSSLETHRNWSKKVKDTSKNGRQPSLFNAYSCLFNALYKGIPWSHPERSVSLAV